MRGTAERGKQSFLSDVKPSKAIVHLAVPATLALLAKAVYNIVDTVYIGMLDSDIALAAVGVMPLLLTLAVEVVYILLAQPLILPRVFGVSGIYFSQPAADILTIFICMFLIPAMKRMASQTMKEAK